MKNLLVVLLFLAACAPQVPIDAGPPIEAYFCERDNCTALLVGKIAQSREAVCALYDVSIPEVLQALDKIEWKTEDGKSPLMHNKFCVFDQNTVWTGSWNPTRTTRANNVVIIGSAALARNYLDEYAELPGGRRHVVRPKISYNGHLIENYFCPEDRCKDRVLEQLAGARRQIVFLLADLTDQDIIAALRRTDIEVKGAIDKAEHDALRALPFAQNGSIHHKAFVIDGNTVVTGSYNPTRNGNEYNDENILIIHDPAVAKKFLDEYAYLVNSA